MISSNFGLLLALTAPLVSLGLELDAKSNSYVARAEADCPDLPTSNGGRKIAIVIDSSGSNYATDPQDLRIAAGKELNSLLLTKAEAGGTRQSDLVTVIDFDSTASVISPLGDPANATFEGINASGGTYIAEGVKVAIDELIKEKGGAKAGKTGIVVLTDGNTSDLEELVIELGRARGLNIRVAFGFLSPEAPTGASDLLTAILSTGGIYSTISSAEAQENFVNLVVAHGLTDVDTGDTKNSTVALYPGLSVAGNVSSSTGPKTYSYIAQVGEKLNFTISAISGQKLDLTLRAGDGAKDVNTTKTDSSGAAGFRFNVAKAGEYTVEVATANATSGLFTISLNSSTTNGNQPTRCKPSKLKPSTK